MSSKLPSRKRHLTAEEAELWARAMRDAKKNPQNAGQAQKMPQAGPTGTPPPLEAKPRSPENVNRKPDSPPLSLPPQRSPKPPPAPPPLANFDQRQKRKLVRNAESIDGRIDLHGMRQNEAHSALRRFLHASAARGDRNLLVITGKGTRGDLERTRDYMSGEQRGVLRRLVPQWFMEPDLRKLVVSFTTAGPRHGGEGALYVRIRKAHRGD